VYRYVGGSCCPSTGGFSILTACSTSGKGAVEGGSVFSMPFARRLPALRQGG
jgi:hypothetical protein